MILPCQNRFRGFRRLACTRNTRACPSNCGNSRWPDLSRARTPRNYRARQASQCTTRKRKPSEDGQIFASLAPCNVLGASCQLTAGSTTKTGAGGTISCLIPVTIAWRSAGCHRQLSKEQFLSLVSVQGHQLKRMRFGVRQTSVLSFSLKRTLLLLGRSASKIDSEDTPQSLKRRLAWPVVRPHPFFRNSDVMEQCLRAWR